MPELNPAYGFFVDIFKSKRQIFRGKHDGRTHEQIDARRISRKPGKLFPYPKNDLPYLAEDRGRNE